MNITKIKLCDRNLISGSPSCKHIRLNLASTSIPTRESLLTDRETINRCRGTQTKVGTVPTVTDPVGKRKKATQGLSTLWRPLLARQPASCFNK